jgi:hypothetical protein
MLLLLYLVPFEVIYYEPYWLERVLTKNEKFNWRRKGAIYYNVTKGQQENQKESCLNE